MDLVSLFEANAFHGSKHDFSEFSVDHVGTGYGIQRFGYGIYLTKNRSVARYYRTSKGIIYHVEMPNDDEMLDWNLQFSAQSNIVQRALISMRYPEIRQRMIDDEAIGGYEKSEYTDDTGEDIYGVLVSDQPMPDFGKGHREDQKIVSLEMLKHGIAGTRYPDDDFGGFNYVIFDPRRIVIQKKTKS